MTRFASLAMGLALALPSARPIAQTPPARNLFRTTVLLSNLSNPTQICFRPDGKLYLLSKEGTVKLFDPKGAGQPIQALSIKASNVREDGLHGIALDPAFASNRHLYLLFGSLTPFQCMVIARFTAKDDGTLDPASRRDILTVPYSLTSSDEHNTGNLAMAPNGDLYIGLADNTNNFFSGPTIGFSPRDPARPNFDAQRSASNTDDLRGKILRIHPLPFADADSPAPGAGSTYSIPAGNLFPTASTIAAAGSSGLGGASASAGAEAGKTRPEIYVMGLRHPFRITVDAKTGWLFWAEPGPNASADDPNQGPRGYDEVNIARTAGNYGWPYCVGDNFCYKAYDYKTNLGATAYDPKALKNASPNNTGLTDLPPARPALIWYPYNAANSAFPVFGSGSSNTSMLGQVYDFNASIANANKIPRYYDRNLFIFDFSRTLIHAVRLNDTGGAATVERFWDQTAANPIKNPIDMKVGPDGAFYFLGWGDNGSYPANAGHGNLVKLDYTGPAEAVIPALPRSGSILAAAPSYWSLLAPGARWNPPSRAASAEAYDLRGRMVWNWHFGAPHPRAVEAPLRVHFLPH
jgi:cytochrome c